MQAEHLIQKCETRSEKILTSSDMGDETCCKLTSTLVHGNQAKPKCPSLALLRRKLTFEIFELGLAEQIELSKI